MSPWLESVPSISSDRSSTGGRDYIAVAIFSLFLLGAKPIELGAKPIELGAKPIGTKNGLVVSAHPLASEAGARMLRQGGNAIDAAVVVAYVLSVVEPYSAGIGGGGFLLFRDAESKTTHVADYREVAPKRATRDMYVVDGAVDSKLSVEGILSVAVPGMVPGLAEVQAKWGRKTLAESLDDAIVLSEQGFEVEAAFARASVKRRALLADNPEAARIFLKKDGSPYQEGDRLIQSDLAKTLRRLKREGPRLFTHGAIAQAISDESRRLGGVLERTDLENFKTRWRAPLVGNYRGHTVFTMPPPSSGGTHLLQILRMLEFDRVQRGRRGYWLHGDDQHVLVESMRLAYADRAKHLGDPAFYDVPLSFLLSDDYLASRYARIDLKHAHPSTTVAAGRPEPHDTTHFTIIDRDSNVVSLTQTINYSFGAGVVVPGTGVLLNNEMDDFAAAPGTPNTYGLVGGEANSIQPGKVPLSSMTPTIVVKDGKVRLAVGAPGGSTIITTVLQVILQVIDYGLDVQSAVSTPRIHHQWLPDTLAVEEGALTDGLRRDLTNRGHVITVRPYWGNATAIEVSPDGIRTGAADPRGDGTAVAE